MYQTDSVVKTKSKKKKITKKKNNKKTKKRQHQKKKNQMENIGKIDVAKFSSSSKEFCRVNMLQKLGKRADCYASLLARGQ